VRYEIKREIRKRTNLSDYEYLLDHLASYHGEQVRIAFLHNPNSGYLLFIGESPVMLLGILHSKKTMERRIMRNVEIKAKADFRQINISPHQFS